jgi:glycosyltransferase involved in cell wall biosynthesis
MPPGEPLLLLCHAFPPVPGIGGRRWAKFARELARRGHPVHVVRATPDPQVPPSLWSADAEQAGITAYPLPVRYPQVLRRIPVTGLVDKLRYHAWMKLLPRLTPGNWFDPACLSRNDVLAVAEKLLREQDIRLLVATGAPFSLLGYAAELKERRPELRFIADLRDAWTWAPHYGGASLGPERLRREQALEARVIRVADKVITPHPHVVEHLRATYPEHPDRFVCIPNAIDPEELGEPATSANDGRFRLVYAGSLYGAQEAEVYFGEVIKAFQRLRETHPEKFALAQFDLWITGHDTRPYQERVLRAGLQERIRFHAPQPAREIFRQITSADLVLIFIPAVNKDILGTKFAEVFHARRPILHVGAPGLVGDTITDRRLGASLRVEEVVSELPRIMAGERRIGVDPGADHGEWLLPGITDRLISEVLQRPRTATAHPIAAAPPAS